MDKIKGEGCDDCQICCGWQLTLLTTCLLWPYFRVPFCDRTLQNSQKHSSKKSLGREKNIMDDWKEQSANKWREGTALSHKIRHLLNCLPSMEEMHKIHCLYHTHAKWDLDRWFLLCGFVQLCNVVCESLSLSTHTHTHTHTHTCM